MRDSVYPRPQFARDRWQSLNGSWDYSFSDAARPEDVAWTGKIEVPFPPESSLAGVHDPGFHPVIWYRRTFTVPEDWRGSPLMLRFGAVDYFARIWLNGELVTWHEGGHTPFSVDISHALIAKEQTLIVRADDDPHDMSKPRGKQDWQPEPHGIWYPRTTGIWQSVWLEPVPATRIESVRFTPDVTAFEIGVEVDVVGSTDGTSLELVLSQDGAVLSSDAWTADSATARGIRLARRSFDDLDRFLWSPEHPTLIDVDLVLKRGGAELDRVKSYTALRSAEARNGKFLLNGRPYFLRLALDQGYWDDSLLAAPSDEALRRDVELAKALGFNGVRKHQKIEDPRYLYWADRLGLLVWTEMPSAYDFTPRTVHRLTKEWLEVVERDYNHPCIVTWVCFNESWGVPDLPHDVRQRSFVESIYHLTKSIDATRPVVGNDGWEHVVTDLLTIHDYSRTPETLSRRYGTARASVATTGEMLEHGRAILLEHSAHTGQPVILSEFGGIRFHPGEQGWGYQQVDDSDTFVELYQAMVTALSPEGLAGFCYTQFADTFQEQNGLLYSDRRPKAPLDALARATLGGG